MSYSRFVDLIPSVLVPLSAYLEACRGTCNGLSFVDSTKLTVCHNRRIKHHRVFAGLAERGKDSVDWFYGFKLHLVSMTAANCSPADSPQPMSMTAAPCLSWPSASLAN